MYTCDLVIIHFHHRDAIFNIACGRIDSSGFNEFTTSQLYYRKLWNYGLFRHANAREAI